MKSLVKRTIDDASVEELKQELKRREAEAKAAMRPVPLKEFDMTKLIAVCERRLNEYLADASDDTDTPHATSKLFRKTLTGA